MSSSTLPDDDDGSKSPRLARRVTFNDAVHFDDGLVPVRSRHHDDDAVELGDLKKGRVVRTSSVPSIDPLPPAPNGAAGATTTAGEEQRPRPEDGDLVCGLRKRTIIILSLVAALILGALLGGLAGGLIAQRRVVVYNSPPT